MTRFIMSINEAVRLVIDSAVEAFGGEVFVTKMPVIRIKDLAEVMIKELAPIFGHPPENISIDIIGTKPGEKMYEELMSQEETRRTWELKRYFVVYPAFISFYRNMRYDYKDIISKSVHEPYNSANEKPLSKSELLEFLISNKLLEDNPVQIQHPSERFWPHQVGHLKNLAFIHLT